MQTEKHKISPLGRVADISYLFPNKPLYAPDCVMRLARLLTPLSTETKPRPKRVPYGPSATKNNENGRGVRRTSAAGQCLIIGEIQCGHASEGR